MSARPLVLATPFRRAATLLCTAISLSVVLLVLLGAARADAATQFPSGGGTGPTDLTGNPVWTVAGSPYILNGAVKVKPNATLTINPGVVVKFNGTAASLAIEAAGTLLAGQPTASEPVVFTSINDDSAGGDSNGNGASPAAGDWGRISISGSATFDYADVRYGGNGSSDSSNAAIRMSGGDVTIRRSRIADNQRSGIVNANGVLTVERSLFARNGTAIYTGQGQTSVASGTEIRNNLRDGLSFNLTSTFAGQASTVVDTDIRNNTGLGVNLGVNSALAVDKWPHGSNNNIYANTGQPVGQSEALQLFSNSAKPTVNWTGNFWGPDVQLAVVEPFCEPAYPHRLRYGPLGPLHPIRWSNQPVGSNWCLADMVDGYPFSADYIENGEPEDWMNDEYGFLVTRHAPALLYDSGEQYRVLSPAALAEFYDETSLERDESNSIVDDLGRFGIADPRQAHEDPDNLSQLSRDFLGSTYHDPTTEIPPADVPGRREETPASATDYISARAEIVSVPPLEEDHSTYVEDSLERLPLDGLQIYSHVAGGSDGRIWIQYSLFYYFNSLVPGHEGDWEMVQYGLNQATLEPEVAAYAQHGGGQWCDWDNIARAGNQPHVYVARDSHASYFGKDRIPVGGTDQADGEALDGLVTPGVEEVTETDPAWMAWPGHWGDTNGGAGSPVGPSQGDHQARWNDPGAWASGLDECNPF
jgi:hypothetical protein